ncbi:MAG: NrfD/PsrC family molybdoenzyme membrane anchor subunit, partial [Anaerolineales bacterium]
VLEHPAFSKHPLLDRFPILRKLIGPLHTISHWTHKIAPGLAIAGLTLSLLHQASLGATYSVLAGRGLWFNQSAPVQFVLSAMGGGTALLFFLSIIVFRIMRPGQVKDEVFYDLARIAGGITLLLAYLRIWDWAVTNYYSFDLEISLQTQMLDSIAPYTLSFWLGQVLLPVIAGAVMLAAKSVRSFRILMFFSAFPIFNVILMRWNYNFSGLIASITYDPFTPTVVLNSYTPTWVEFAVGGMVICYALLMFTLAARYLPFKVDSHAEH